MKRLITIVLLGCSFNCASAGESNEVIRFEKELFAPQVLNYFGMGKDRFQSLTPTQRSDLLEAKKTLFSFLMATQNPDADIWRFLSRDLFARYKTRNVFLSKLFGQETEILVNAITDFDPQKNEFNLKYYVVLFSEGNLLVREDLATLRKQDGNWRVISIGGIK